MKRFIELLDEIRKLDGIDMTNIENKDGYDLQPVKDIECLLKEFYIAGYENKGVDINIDFANKLSNFYRYYVPV